MVYLGLGYVTIILTGNLHRKARARRSERASQGGREDAQVLPYEEILAQSRKERKGEESWFGTHPYAGRPVQA